MSISETQPHAYVRTLQRHREITCQHRTRAANKGPKQILLIFVINSTHSTTFNIPPGTGRRLPRRMNSEGLSPCSALGKQIRPHYQFLNIITTANGVGCDTSTRRTILRTKQRYQHEKHYEVTWRAKANSETLPRSRRKRVTI